MIGKFKKQPSNTQQVLRLAACIGSEFGLKTLAVVCEQPAQAVFSDLKGTIQSGLILSLSELDEQLLIQEFDILPRYTRKG